MYIGGVIAGPEQASLYGVQLFASSEAQSVDLALPSAPERYRLMQFLTVWTRWYKLGRADIDARCAGDDAPVNPDVKRSLESYLRKQSLTAAQSFSTPPMTAKSPGPCRSPPGSPTARRHRSLKTPTFGSVGSAGSGGSGGSFGSFGSFGGVGGVSGAGMFNTAGGNTAGGNTGSRRGLDFSAVNAMSVDALKKTQLLKKPAQSGSVRASEMFFLHDLMPYPHHANIPRLLLLLVRALTESEGYKLEGIFRISPSQDENSLLKEALSVVVERGCN